MPFGDQVAAEPQKFAHQDIALITVDDDDRVNALIDDLYDEPKILDALLFTERDRIKIHDGTVVAWLDRGDQRRRGRRSAPLTGSPPGAQW